MRYTTLSLILLLLIAAGCGGSKWKAKVEFVEGCVTMDGVPLEGATVQFSPKGEDADAREAAGGYTDAKGRYKLSSLNGEPSKGAMIGEYSVLISKIVFVKIPGKMRVEGEAELEREDQITPLIYKDLQKTPLSATVAKGKNVFDFELKSKP